MRRSPLVLLALSLALSAGARTPTGGVVVATVEPGSAAERAGLRPGDRLLAWERLASPPANPSSERGELRTVSDWYVVSRERSPRGPLRLAGSREGRPLEVSLPPGGAGAFDVYPVLGETARTRVREAESLLEAKDPAGASRAWRSLASATGEPAEEAFSFWVWMRTGEACDAARSWDEARAAWAEALGAARRAGLAGAVFVAMNGAGESRFASGDLAAAEEVFRSQWEFARDTWGSLSLSGAKALGNLNAVYWERGDYDRAEACVLQAVEIYRQGVPGSLGLSRALNNLGNIRWAKGDLSGAEEAYGRSLALKEVLAPDSLTLASSCNNLGVLADERGDLVLAERYFRRALDLREKLQPGGLVGAKTLNNLGYLAAKRGLLDEAEVDYRRALAIREAADPESTETASSVGNLANLAALRHDLEAAEAGWRRALALYRKRSPDGADVPRCLCNLGRLARERGELTGAAALYAEAEALQRKQVPGSLNHSESLFGTGQVRMAQGDLAGAERAYAEALAVRERLAPDSLREAEVLAALAALQRQRGDTGSEREYLRRAVSALEGQMGRLGGGSQATENLSASGAEIYRDLVTLEARLGESSAAFATLERFRARSFLQMLAARDLDFAADAPAGLLRERKLLDFQYDRLQADLAEASAAGTPEQVEALRGRLKEVTAERRQVGERIRQASPRLADLQEPTPLDLEGARRVVPPGTLFLSYCTAGDATWLFALLDGRLEAYPIPVTRGGLAREVRRFRHLIADPATPGPALDRASRRLYDRLLAPARAPLARASRLLVCPDGPLHALPFAALRGPAGKYVVEERPIGHVVSATVLAQIVGEARRGGARLPLAAFGDPARRPGPGALAPLPAAREEVTSLAARFPGGASVYLGADATEERVRQVAPTVRYLHFACHGLLDERFPLDSGLALAEPPEGVPGQENGRLQAWEILQALRLDADLVTLSACDTGLGREMGGEGLVGLTRAFLYAGSRSVLSSLWSVGDASTARLMGRFYAHLQQGLPRDEALRAAQLELLRAPGRATAQGQEAHPFHWAAFALSGDCR